MNWLVDKLRTMEDKVADVNEEVPKADPTPAQPTVTIPPDQLQVLAGMVASQLSGLVKVATDDMIKGNFSGAWGDVKAQAINDGITDAIQVTRVIEQQLMTHIAGLGTSKQLDIAKGKISDAFIWIEKHLGIGG